MNQDRFPALLLAVCLSIPAAGQSRDTVKLRQDTAVELRLTSALSSADAKVGERVELEVVESVRTGDVTLVERGAKAFAVVSEAVPKARMGRNGKLSVRVDAVCLVNGSIAPLRALREVDRAKWGAMQGEPSLGDLLMALPAAPVLLFVQGKDIIVPKGREVTAYVAADVTLPASMTRRSCDGNQASAETPGATTPGPQAPTTAVVSVQSTPPGADIYIGGKFVGSTPSTFRLAPGDQRISVVKNGYKSWERAVWISAGGDILLQATLEETAKEMPMTGGMPPAPVTGRIK